jgi:uncharacterized membrane protein
MKNEDDCDRPHHPILKAIAVLIIFIIIVAIVARAVGFAGPGMMAGPGWGLLGTVIVILFLLWLISWVFGMAGTHRHRHWDWDNSDRATSILKRRYARGEISESEFKKMMKNLKEEK